jgi:transglutaminase/protease-like cytokinesis protein 3
MKITKKQIIRLFFTLIIFYPNLLFSQNPKIDSIIHSIPFKQDTIKSVFDWVVNNIEYDMNRYENKTKIRPLFVLNEQEKINNALLKRRGVCEDYALVFNALLRRLGYNSYVVDGYAKDLNKIVNDAGHAWNVIKIKNKWYCFDPTWESNIISDKKPDATFDSIWFKIDPNEFILTHVPYDPIWQLNEYPVIAKTNNLHIPINEYFNFEDSIHLYNEARDILSAQNLIYRVTKYSDKNENVNHYIEILVSNLENSKYNKAIELLNNSVSSFNAYIHYRNKKFQKPKLKDSEIKSLLLSIQKEIDAAKSLLLSLSAVNNSGKRDTFQKINELENRVSEEINYVKKNEKMKSSLKVFFK